MFDHLPDSTYVHTYAYTYTYICMIAEKKGNHDTRETRIEHYVH